MTDAELALDDPVRLQRLRTEMDIVKFYRDRIALGLTQMIQSAGLALAVLAGVNSNFIAQALENKEYRVTIVVIAYVTVMALFLTMVQAGMTAGINRYQFRKLYPSLFKNENYFGRGTSDTNAWFGTVAGPLLTLVVVLVFFLSGLFNKAPTWKIHDKSLISQVTSKK